jgi:TonB family protein
MISYFLWVNLYVLLLFALYALFLRNKSNHPWSRFYLLSAVLISIVLPLIKMDLDIADPKQLATISQLLPEVVLNRSVNTVNKMDMNWPLIVYQLASISMLLLFCFRILKLAAFLKQHKPGKESGFRIALNTGMGPASFGNIIIFPGTEIGPEILKHEIAHLHCRHHYDKLFINLILCFFFPVVAFYFIKKELETVHEFEADALAADDQEHYATLLLNQHFQTQQFSLLQPFFHHPIKRRIMMLYSKKTTSKKRRGAVIIFSAAFIVAGIVFQSQSDLIAQEKTKSNTTSQSDAKKITRENIKDAGPENLYYQEKQGEKWVMVDSPPQNSGKVFTSVEQMPEFPGGRDSLMSFLAQNIRYPVNGKNDKAEGTVIARFIVSENGQVEDATILRKVRQDYDAEVLRVLNAMPLWKAGTLNGKKVRVYYTLPVKFKLN